MFATVFEDENHFIFNIFCVTPTDNPIGESRYSEGTVKISHGPWVMIRAWTLKNEKEPSIFLEVNKKTLSDFKQVSEEF